MTIFTRGTVARVLLVAMAGPSSARLAHALDALGADSERVGENTWSVRLPSVKRGAITVGILCAERTARFNAFFMRGPDRAHVDVYRGLLRKNLELRDWRFAVDDDGDLFLAAAVAVSELSEARLDELLGALVFAVDETFEGVLRTGFEVPDGAVVGERPVP
jgi:Putative bacterial sensory transduction regulator